MVEFKAVINASSKSYSHNIRGDIGDTLIGKKINDEIDGNFIEFPGYAFKITGGSDKEGFPMAKSFNGGRRIRTLLTVGLGFHPDKRGLKKKKSFRGNTIYNDIVQINLKVTKYGNKPIEDIIKEIQEKEKNMKEAEENKK